MALNRILTASRQRAQAFEEYQQTHQILKLQLGSGTHELPGWFNTDLISRSADVHFLDSTQQFPFADSIFDYVYSEHHIEHLSFNEGLFTLRECFRVLRPGGRIRIATPSLETLLGLYTPTPDEQQRHYLRFIKDAFVGEAAGSDAAFVINNAFRNWGHQFLYDQATLGNSLEQAGFFHIVRVAYQESGDLHFRGIEQHGQFIGDEEIARFETMILEAGCGHVRHRIAQQLNPDPLTSN